MQICIHTYITLRWPCSTIFRFHGIHRDTHACLHYIAKDHISEALHCVSSCYIALYFITLRYHITSETLHTFNEFHNISLRLMNFALHCFSVPNLISLPYIIWSWIALLCSTSPLCFFSNHMFSLLYMTLHYIEVHFIPLHYPVLYYIDYMFLFNDFFTL